MQAFEGYIENGNVFPVGQILRIPERRKVIITVLDEPAVEAENIGELRRAAFGCAKGKMWMADDFDAPLDELREYME